MRLSRSLVRVASWSLLGISVVAAAPRTAGAQESAADVGASGPSTGRWRGGVLLDEDARGALLAPSLDGRELAATVSDALIVALLAQAALVDALWAPLTRGPAERVWQGELALGFALGVTMILGEAVKSAVGRARPFERRCVEGSQLPECQDPDRFASFYSLHSAVAFTSAGFSCAMHLEHGLHGDGGADLAACSASLVGASVVGLLRVVADRHYLSDVLVGAAIGFLVGYAVPALLVGSRSAQAEPDPRAGPQVAVLPLASPSPGGGMYGITVAGSF